MTELMGHTHTAAYTAPWSRQLGSASSPAFLPTISTMKASYQQPFRRSMTSLPYRSEAHSGYCTPRVGGASLSNSWGNMAGGQMNSDTFKVPPIAGLNRYTTFDWMASNQNNFMTSDRIRGGSERVRLDTSRLCREADDRTARTQQEVDRRLSDRISDIHQWHTEVRNEIENMVTETDALTRAKSCLEKMLVETEQPLHVSQECLYGREKRIGIDLVQDAVERELTKEVDNIKKCQEEMRRLVQRSSNQLSLNRAAQNDLEKDLRDKGLALKIDDTCHQLRNGSRGLGYHNGVERIDNTQSIPESWMQFSNDNISRSQGQRAASRDTRSLIEQLMNRVSTAIMNHWNSTNNALTERNREYMDIKNQLQTHLARTNQEIFDMEKNIELLTRCIKEKESPLQVAQTRLVNRNRRPNIEICRDPVHHRLVDEVVEINETLESLKMKLREAENTMQHLLRTKMSLESDLEIKNNSIHIDREGCLSMRKSFPMLARLAVY